MINIICNPWNVVYLAGKRIRTMPIKDIEKAQINDFDNHGVVLTPISKEENNEFITQRELAKIVASYEGTWNLIHSRKRCESLSVIGHYFPGGHE